MNNGKLWSRFFSPERLHGNVALNFTRFPRGEFAVYGRSYHEAGQHLVKHVDGLDDVGFPLQICAD